MACRKRRATRFPFSSMATELPACNPGWQDNIVNSPEDARRIVRKLKQQGVDLIKIMPSGGVLSIGDDPSRQLMADDEIAAVVQTAHALGLKVAAHDIGVVPINAAVR